MRIARLETVDLHWREDGDPAGLPVVFANSLGTDLRLWDDVIALLPKRGLRYIRFDKRGHGLSGCTPSPYSMETLADDAEQLLTHLGIERCIFVGLSIGGMIGQMLASRRPDLVRGLVLSNTAAKMGDATSWQTRISAIEAGGIESIADAILDRWFSASFRQSNEALAWRAMLARTPQEGYIGCCHALASADLHVSTAALRLPVLGIAGDEDQASVPAIVKATADLVPGSRFMEMKGAGHLPCVEQPDLYAQTLTAFFKEISDV